MIGVFFNYTRYLYQRLFIVHEINHTWTIVIRKLKTLKEREKRIVFAKDASLMLAMFFLPFGYDALFKLIMDISGSYWIADVVFYSISGCFWLSYILLTRYLNKNETN
jgi:hypothetical protein